MIDYYRKSKDPQVHLDEFKDLIKDGLDKMKQLNYFLNSIYKSNDYSIEQKKIAKELAEFILDRVEKENKLLN
jgi:hypothetical protein